MRKTKQEQIPLTPPTPVPVNVCGVRQNVYRRDILPVHTAPKMYSCARYLSLEKKELPNGYIQELAVKDYPITSESVSSLAEGADYKTDPAQAIAQAPKRVNLGDITEAQAFLENPQNFARVYEDVKEKLLEYYKAKSTEQSDPSEPAPDITDNGGAVNG